jgi:hypothetical protein
MQPTVLITFDVEEFDLPLEYQIQIDLKAQMEIGKKGLDAVCELINEHQIPLTLFTTGSFAREYPDVIADLSTQHEIASHALNHSSFTGSDLLESRLLLEKITGKRVTGFRMPRMHPVEIQGLKDAGYEYDSSVNPTIMPGRYNNSHLPRNLFLEEGFKRLPTSVSPNMRIPLFWLSFKNFPYHLYLSLALQTLKKDGYLHLYFHPWEFTDISKFKLPFYIKRHSGAHLQQKLHRLISDLKKMASFNTISSYINEGYPLLVKEKH